MTTPIYDVIPRCLTTVQNSVHSMPSISSLIGSSPPLPPQVERGVLRGSSVKLKFYIFYGPLFYIGEESFLQYLDHSGGREGKRCEFSLGVLPPPLRVPWLRVFYIILYKVIRHSLTHTHTHIHTHTHLHSTYTVIRVQ